MKVYLLQTIRNTYSCVCVIMNLLQTQKRLGRVYESVLIADNQKGLVMFMIVCLCVLIPDSKLGRVYDNVYIA